MTSHQQIIIEHLPIRLGQFLKLANLVQDGLEAKIRIQNGEVSVNGVTETQRGKQLKAGDIIFCNGRELVICSDPGA